jgi:hypothetical protein
MSLAIVDAREWQNLLDLETGKKVQDERPQTLMVRSILKKHPYPGDVDDRSNVWVTDAALDSVEAISRSWRASSIRISSLRAAIVRCRTISAER